MERVNLCAPYKYNGEHNCHLSEYNVTFNDKTSSIDKLCEFLEYEDADVPNKRVNICYTNGYNRKTHRMLSKFHNNLHVRLVPEDFDKLGQMSEDGIKFFYPETHPARNWVSLDAMISCGVTSVYISDDLCYRVKDVHDCCAAAHVQVRCVLNRIPCYMYRQTFTPMAMVYCPKDIDTLSKYYDMFEFDCGTTMNHDWHLFNALFRTWFVNKCWGGNIQEINPDLGFELHEKALLNRYLANKYNCGAVCLKNEDVCFKCDNYYDVSCKLHKRGMKVNQKAKE